MKKMFSILGSFILLLNACKGAVGDSSKCPKLEDLQKTINNIQQGIHLEKVSPTPIHGLCEVVVKVSDSDRGIFYTDSQGKYVITGNIIELSSMKNLTGERLASLNKKVLPKETLAELEKYVAFTVGTSPNYVYLITDPDCPYCKKAEAILEELIKSGKLTVKVILFPLEPLHPQAKAKAISIFCDKKGFEGLKAGYLSNNQCAEGKSLVEESINFMQKIGVRGTPTFVFPDGEMKSGVLSPEYIFSKFEKKS
ncbi:MAG: DsbC family protein [Caldimicrobium sp.]